MTPSLAALIEMVEKLEKPGPHEALPNGLVSLTHTVFGASWAQNCLFRALRGDLSSAVAFTEALLPGCPANIYWGPLGAGAFVERPLGNPIYHGTEFSPTPALALVLAALRAHAAKETI